MQKWGLPDTEQLASIDTSDQKLAFVAPTTGIRDIVSQDTARQLIAIMAQRNIRKSVTGKSDDISGLSVAEYIKIITQITEARDMVHILLADLLFPVLIETIGMHLAGPQNVFTPKSEFVLKINPGGDVFALVQLTDMLTG